MRRDAPAGHRRRTRAAAITLGTAGIIAPLIAGANPRVLGHIGAYGYALLAGAASMLLANKLFDVTGGHVRYFAAQLELERLLTLFRLDWATWLAKTSGRELDQEGLTQAFALLRAFACESYKIIMDETNVWGKSVSDALEEYAHYVSSRRPPGNDA